MQMLFLTLLIAFGSFIAGWALVQGKMKILLGMIFLLLGLPFFNYLSGVSERTRLYLFIAAIILIPIQTPTLGIIPYGIGISEILLIILVFHYLLFTGHVKQTLNTANDHPYGIFICIIFTAVALLPAILNDEIREWQIACVIPLSLMYLSKNMIHTQRDALQLLYAVVFAIVGYLIIFYLARSTGHFIEGYDLRFQWRIGTGLVQFGPIVYESYSIGFGSILALGIPITFYKTFQDRTAGWPGVIYAAIFILLVFLLAITSARAATIGALAGVSVMIVVSFWSHSVWQKALLICFLVAFFTFTAWHRYLTLIPGIQESIVRWQMTNWFALSLEATISERIDLLIMSMEGAMMNPLGNGFQYLQTIGAVNDSGFGYLLNGTGIMGFTGFIAIISVLSARFVKGIFRGAASFQRNIAAIGLATMVSALFSSFSSYTIMHDAASSLLFWSIMATTYSGVTKK